jgi:hypothetical protein
MKKHLLIALVLLTVASAAALAFVKVLPNHSPEVSMASPHKTLRERAKRAGSATASAYPRNLKRYDDLGSLAQESSAIVIGRVESKAASLLQPAETLIVTDFQVTINNVFKGEFISGQTIKVREPGGHYDFGDGTSADVQMPDFWKNPEIGDQAVFFLTKKADGVFSLVGGPQGMFQITGPTIASAARAEDTLSQTYTGKSAVSFIAEVRDASKR